MKPEITSLTEPDVRRIYLWDVVPPGYMLVYGDLRAVNPEGWDPAKAKGVPVTAIVDEESRRAFGEDLGIATWPAGPPPLGRSPFADVLEMVEALERAKR